MRSRDQTDRVAAGVAFRLLDRTVGLTTPTPEIARRAADLIPEYSVPLDRHPLDDALHLQEEDGHWSIRSQQTQPERFASVSSALETAEFLISVRLLTLVSHLPHLHAAGAVVDGKAILALGEAGAGKTSLALHWCMTGHPVLGDDVVFLDELGQAQPFKRLFSTDRRRLEHYGTRPDSRNDPAGGSDEVWFDPTSAAGWADPAPVCLLGLIRYDPGTPFQMREMRRAETLNVLAASILPTGMAPGRCFDQLTRIASRAKAVEIAFDDSARAADELRALA